MSADYWTLEPKENPTLNILTWQPQPATPFYFQVLLKYLVTILQRLPNVSQLEVKKIKAGRNERRVFQAEGRESAKAMKCTWCGFTEETCISEAASEKEEKPRV